MNQIQHSIESLNQDLSFLGLYSLSVKFVSLHLARVVDQSTLWLQDPQVAPESQPHVAPGQGAKIFINWIWMWNEFVLPLKKQAYKETKNYVQKNSDHLWCFPNILFFLKILFLVEEKKSSEVLEATWQIQIWKSSNLALGNDGFNLSVPWANLLLEKDHQSFWPIALGQISANPRLRNEKIVRSQTGGV